MMLCILMGLAWVGSCQTALLCDRTREPAFFWLDEPSHCDETGGAPAKPNITTDQVTSFRVKGWIILLQEFECTTHYFVWGSYSMTHNFMPDNADLRDMPDPVCPEGYIRYTNLQDLLKLCEWAGPTSVSVNKKVCKISSGTMENSPGGFFVEGARASCLD
ncbi:unnamed protein product [Parnassius apollo]|uniref:(apollo) hypothetical protein n=1 Tax=Parnassius apollo TaxID=110799 RepID=A0A8S3XKP9_PARAO|nr:unnamed protein product [Parnassius apollo]